jgi:sterol 3beta-glucosyltransferase
MINGVLLPFINDLRRKNGLKEVESFRDVWESPLCNLIAVSPILCEPREDWKSNNHVCGFFKMNESVNKWKMPENLETFLNSGTLPVYMTLGSMAGTENNSLIINETTRLLFDAAKLAGCKAVIQSRWDYVSGIQEDENIFRVNSSPYMKVFPKCGAVVHHGGAGTTQSATISGCPSIIVAHIQDQFLWGKELNRLGIGRKTLNRRNVTSKKIAHEIRAVLENKSMAENAKIIGKKLRNEDGVINAVKIINEVLMKIK